MRFIAVLLSLLFVAQSAAETIAVIGTGRVGSALGTELAAEGHTIVYGSRDPTTEAVRDLVARTGDGTTARLQSKAVAGADIVILAVPGMLAGDITKNLGDLSGKIVIDPTNPLNFTAEGVSHGVPTSNGEIIQAAAPDAFVVKAFNVLSWEYMIDPARSGGPISIPLAGNDETAKARVAEIVASLDLHPIDLGPIDHSRWIEGMAILLIHNNFTPLPAFNFHLREVQ
ncbi:MAG: NAD(P)-binding domain-containing protein [Woeseiaceae bacterium]|nr:NAD(P)-binding domain-containing protein [Woeseiaceae bacterium]